MPAATDYFLRSARLGFRCWSSDDLPLALALWGDHRVTQFIGGPFSPEQIEHRLKKENDSLREHHFQYWPVFLLSDGQHIGCAGLRPYKLEEKIHELGFHLRPEFWGRGFAKEAAHAVIAYAFETLHAKALSAGTTLRTLHRVTSSKNSAFISLMRSFMLLAACKSLTICWLAPPLVFLDFFLRP